MSYEQKFEKEQSIPVVNDELSAAQNMLSFNCECSNTEVLFSRLVGRVSCSFVGVVTKKDENIEFYMEQGFILEKELERSSDIMHGSKLFIIELADGAPQKNLSRKRSR